MPRQRHQTPSRRPRKRGCGCLNLIAALGIGVLALLALYAFLVRPTVSAFIGQRVSERLVENLEVGETILPDAIAALPAGQTVVNQQQARDFITNHPGVAGPIDDLNLTFAGDQVVADLTFLGMPGEARTGLTATNGQISVVAPHIDGALGLAVSTDELINPLIDALNAELARQEKYVETLQIENGQIVIVTR